MAYQKTGRNARMRLSRTGAGKLVATRVAKWRPKAPPVPPRPKALTKPAATTLPSFDRRPTIARTTTKPVAPKSQSRRRPVRQKQSARRMRKA